MDLSNRSNLPGVLQEKYHLAEKATHYITEALHELGYKNLRCILHFNCNSEGPTYSERDLLHFEFIQKRIFFGKSLVTMVLSMKEVVQGKPFFRVLYQNQQVGLDRAVEQLVSYLQKIFQTDITLEELDELSDFSRFFSLDERAKREKWRKQWDFKRVRQTYQGIQKVQDQFNRRLEQVDDRLFCMAQHDIIGSQASQQVDTRRSILYFTTLQKKRVGKKKVVSMKLGLRHLVAGHPVLHVYFDDASYEEPLEKHIAWFTKQLSSVFGMETPYSIETKKQYTAHTDAVSDRSSHKHLPA